MHRPELLVHVTAPASLRDDRGYLAVTQSIIDFEPARITCVIPVAHDLTPSAQRGCYSSLQPAEIPVEPNNTPRSENLSSTCFTLPTNTKRHCPRTSASFRTWRVTKTPQEKQALNRKPSSIPRDFVGNAFIERPSSTPVENHNSTQIVRLGKVSALHSNHVLVPFTGRKRQRNQPRSGLILSQSSQVCDSQVSPNSKPGPPCDVGLNSTTNPTDHCCAEDDHGLELSFSQTSLEDDPPHKKQRTDLELGSKAGPSIYKCMHKSFETQSEVDSMDLTSTQSLDTYEEMQNKSSKLSTTVSPSQGRLSTPTHLQVCKPKSKPNADPIVVDLTNSTPAKSSEARAHEDLDRDRYFEADIPNLLRGRSYERIYALPYEVAAPLPKVSFDKFTSHVTTTLANIACRLPVEKYFRPVVVTRDVKVLERGHWRMSITIAPPDMVSKLRAPPTDDEITRALEKRFSGKTAEERFRAFASHVQAREQDKTDHNDYDYETKARNLWTEDEYINFWKSVSTFVGDGKAGLGTRLVREEQTPDSPDSVVQSQVLKIRIRIFTWGELVSHMWLALWVLSDKISERVAMEWIAADGASIVRMAGTRRGQGKLGPWTRKGPPGEGASCGCSDSVL